MARSKRVRKKKPGEEPKPLWERLLSGPRFVVVTVLTVAIGAAVPRVIDMTANGVLPEIHAVAKEDDQLTEDFSKSSPEVIGPGVAAGLARGERIFGDPEVTARLVKTGLQGVRLVIEGSRSDAVRIIGMRARVRATRPVVAGTYFELGPEGEESSVPVGFDLASPQPIAREVLNTSTPGVKLGRFYFGGRSVELKKGESRVYDVTAIAGPFTYEWDIQIDLAAQGRTWSVYRPERPLIVSGRAARYAAAYKYDASTHRWVPLKEGGR
ncbi:hypothetical protein [Nonomuraea typhae]|uniref:hypothetical protein n=1 Tax=Nonomuraea typhae TaxID=2603600 RepID=UPI0012F922E2|nr:hypothetical protein [Nonomuraea typhae]